MALAIHRYRRVSASIVFALTVLFLPGCLPTFCTWLPDSSGFIYAKPIPPKNPKEPPTECQFIHYDLKQMTERLIMTGSPSWPAVSPDGKRIAIARLQGGVKEAKTIRLEIRDLQGKQLHQTTELPWAPPREINSSAPMLFWSPRGDMLVVTDGNETGIYDVKADTLKVLGNVVPAIHGSTPIRPDGKGFLAVKDLEKDGQLLFMDWTGTSQKIDTTNLVALLRKNKKASKDDVFADIAFGPLLLPSWWQGNEAWMGFRRDKITYTIDTAKKSVTISDAFAAAMTEKEDYFKNEAVFRFDFAGSVSVHFIRATGDDVDKIAVVTTKVATVNHKTRKNETLWFLGHQSGMFFPSPDGKHLALSLAELTFKDGPTPAHILVISSNGEMHPKIIVQP